MRRMMVWGVLLLAHVLAWGGGMTPVVSVPDAMVFGTTAVVPLRPMAELLGAKLSFSRKTATVRLNHRKVEFRMNRRTAQVNGTSVRLPLAVFARVGFSYVPLRPLITGLGCGLALDTKSSTFTVIYQGITLHLPIKPQPGSPAAFWDNDSELYMANIDGSGDKRLTYNISDDDDMILSKDGTLMVCLRDGIFWLRRVDSPEERPLLSQYRRYHPGSTFSLPSLSPDGRQIICKEGEPVNDPHSQYNYNYFVFIVNTDGSNAHRLRKGSINEISPDWNWLVCNDNDHDYLVHRATNRSWPIGKTQTCFFSPDNSTFIYRLKDQFTLDDKQRNCSLMWSCTLTADQPETFVRLPADRPTEREAISPDGHWVAFTWQDYAIGPSAKSRPGIYSMRLDGSELHQLTSDPTDCAPKFSPTGNEILFERGGNAWLMKSDGTAQRYLTNVSTDCCIGFTPTEKDILFERDFCLWSIKHDGSKQHMLEPVFQSSVVCSPDGQRVYYPYTPYALYMDIN